MKKLRVLIVEDEALARSGLRKMLDKVPDMEVVAEAANGAQALAAIKAKAPDLMLLDVQMPGMSGIQLLQQIPSGQMPLIIFCTAHDEYALKAFDLHAVDYLLKPFDNRRFAQALEHARVKHRTGDPAQIARQLDDLVAYIKTARETPVNGGAGSAHDRIVVKADGDLHFISAADIVWIEGQGDYLKIHGRQQSVVVRDTMTQWEQKLDAQRFMRVHKSAIVNLDHVRKLKPVHYGDHALEMDNSHSVRIGRAYRDKLRTNMVERH